MLNLTIAMRQSSLLFILMIGVLCFGASLVSAQTGPQIDAPEEGQTVHGLVSVSGSTQNDNFESADLSYRSEESDQDQWTVFQTSDQPVSEGVIGAWDTTELPDGIYILRLVVNLEDGSTEGVSVQDIRVKNSSSPTSDLSEDYEQPTRDDQAGVVTPTKLSPSITDTPENKAITSTPLPGNPAQVTRTDLAVSLAKGGAITVGLFVFLGLYLLLRAVFNR